MSKEELKKEIKELKKEIRERFEYCDFGEIVDFHIYDSRVEKGKFLHCDVITLVHCDVITIKNHIVTKVYFTYDVEKKRLEVTDLKNLY